MTETNFSGTLPARLLRFFSHREQALTFLDGCVRLGELGVYRPMEGARGDASETEGRLVVPGEQGNPVNYSTPILHPTYILSFCSPDVDITLMAARFGKFLVRVVDAEVIAMSLYEHLLAHGAAGLKLYFGDRGPVSYSKDQAVQSTPDRSERWRLSWMQKPPDPYSVEQEHRIAFICEGIREDAPRYICVPLSARVDGQLEELST